MTSTLRGPCASPATLAEVMSLVGVHHIGSTAVSGLAAKPIIDVIALVDDLDLLVNGLVDWAGYQFPERENAGLVVGVGSAIRRRDIAPITSCS